MNRDVMSMRRDRLNLLGFTAVLAVALCGCARMPRGDWRIETGRARVVDDRGERQPRMEAVALAQRDARLNLLRYVEAMPLPESNLVGDHLAQDALIGVRVRSLILTSRQFATRYRGDGTVEVDMGVNLDQIRQVVRGAKP